MDNRDYIATHVKNHLLHESSGLEDFVNTIRTSLSTAKDKFRQFLDLVMKGDVAGVDKKDVAFSLKTSASGANLLKDPAFKARVGLAARNIGVQPRDLIRLMNKESRLNPRAVNPKTKATGLIQFMPSTAAKLGTSVQELRNMSALVQMDYVERYFQPYRGKIHDYEDLYIATFWPAALGKSDSTIIASRNLSAQTISSQNPVIARAAGKQPGEPLTIGDFRVYANAS
jgi:hypothetical protein